MSDATSRYQIALSQGVITAERTRELLHGQKVLFVRGFLSETVLKIADLIRKLPAQEIADSHAGQAVSWARDLIQAPEPQRIGEYFDTQTQWLQDEHISFVCADIESEAPVRQNAQKILPYLAGPEPITIISHSKGCLDTLQALLDAPDTWKKVNGWIAIQGPFHGAPVADFVASRPLLRQAARVLLEAAKGELEGLTDMRSATRDTYLANNHDAIAALLEKIPTVCMASSISSKQLHHTFLGPTLLLTKLLTGEDNDGLVPASSATLQDAWTVTLDGVDHAMPVMDSLGAFDRVLCTRALLSLLGALKEERRNVMSE